MYSNICNNCGKDSGLQGGSLHCPFCGYAPSDTAPPKAQKKLTSAFALLRKERFDEAKTAFEDMIQKYPECAEGYWGRLRARYHIVYTESADGRMSPKCATRSGANLAEDADYRKATAYATEEYKTFLQAQAEAIRSFCTENNLSKNISIKFTLGDVDSADEYHIKPKSFKKPIIISVAFSFAMIATLSVCFAMGLFHRHKPGAAATCTNAQICTKCEEVLAPAKGHKPGAEANCTEAQSCTVCYATLVAALGHSFFAHILSPRITRII